MAQREELLALPGVEGEGEEFHDATEERMSPNISSDMIPNELEVSIHTRN